MSLAKNVEFLSHLPRMNGLNGLAMFGRSLSSSGVASPLSETTEFGSNPGALKMYSFLPDELPRNAPLVVVLHGCGQTAAGYDAGTGWSALATHYGFSLLMPEQQAANNASTCFNWFVAEDIARGQGEARSIREMIERMVSEHKLDSRKVYITGLSAGGAMTSAMLATYPEVFAAGAIIAGLPFGVATNLREAIHGMMQPTPRPARELGELVRGASKHQGPWPKISVWHGGNDHTVSPANANEIVKQWLDVHGLPPAPMSTTPTDGFPHDVWWNARGDTVIESYTITDVGHGTPLGLAEDDRRYGEAGPFMIDAGISSSYHIANFFGLTGHFRKPRDVTTPAVQDAIKEIATPIATGPAKPVPLATPAPEPVAAMPPPRRRAFKVGNVITRALAAAGLIK